MEITTEQLTEQLIEKYPKIFQESEGNRRSNWHGVPRGWLPIIDKLCGAIQKYCDTPKSVPNPNYVEDRGFDSKDTSTHRYTSVHVPQVTCFQMKEKFAGLRFYAENVDERVRGMINMAEHMCSNTCESCSTEQDLGFTKGWITVRCKKCADEAGKEWMTKKEFQEQYRMHGL